MNIRPSNLKIYRRGYSLQGKQICLHGENELTVQEGLITVFFLAHDEFLELTSENVNDFFPTTPAIFPLSCQNSYQ